MPELPEVETTLRGIKPHFIHQKVEKVIIRHPQLRWPIPADLAKRLQGQILKQITRRSKYLLLQFERGTVILHLGMSGRLSVIDDGEPPKKHDHVDLCFTNKKCLRFTDPRRFGALLWTDEKPTQHPLLKFIGPEPLTSVFTADYLWEKSRGKKAPVKSFIMDSKTVAGVGNIYATESLFQARILPQTPADQVTKAQYAKLVKAIQSVLERAIKKGGTTLKDFMQSDGNPGYFSIELNVYGKEGKPCPRCKTKLKSMRIGQRSTVFCSVCQK